MKKSAFLLVAVIAIAFTSCKKENTCECYVDDEVVSTSTIKDSWSNAIKACDAGDETGIDCKLKY